MNLAFPEWAAFGIGSAIVILFLRAVWKRKLSNYPGVLTSLGILGTFVGIAWALFQFDVSDIEASVPALIGGMRTAFVTSVLGIASAVLLRAIHLIRVDNLSPEPDGVPVEALLATQTEALKSINEALNGEGDTTLLSQFRLMRQETNDHAKALTTEFREFSKTLAEQNTDALIRALESVIRDFNTKLSEQFGENFKQLNEAVGALVGWQDKYKEQLDTSVRLLDASASRLGDTAQSMDAITERASSLTKCAEDLASTLEALTGTREELDLRLEAFQSLAKDAGQALPLIGHNVTALTQGFRDHVESSLSESSRIIEMQKATVSELGDRQKELLTSLTRDISQLAERNRAAIEEQVQSLDKELENALTNSLASLGNQLATLSGRFVEDYQPLTERLRAIVQASRGL